MMTTDPVPFGSDLLGEALRHMEQSLQLLDSAGAPAHIGAHLDLAICKLRETLQDRSPDALPRLRPDLSS
jgi:hypothetical protein